jgi:hypothetical protein
LYFPAKKCPPENRRATRPENGTPSILRNFHRGGNEFSGETEMAKGANPLLMLLK